MKEFIMKAKWMFIGLSVAFVAVIFAWLGFFLRVLRWFLGMMTHNVIIVLIILAVIFILVKMFKALSRDSRK